MELLKRTYLFAGIVIILIGIFSYRTDYRYTIAFLAVGLIVMFLPSSLVRLAERQAAKRLESHAESADTDTADGISEQKTADSSIVAVPDTSILTSTEKETADSPARKSSETFYDLLNSECLHQAFILSCKNAEKEAAYLEPGTELSLRIEARKGFEPAVLVGSMPCSLPPKALAFIEASNREDPQTGFRIFTTGKTLEIDGTVALRCVVFSCRAH